MERFWLPERNELQDIYVEVTVWSNLIPDDGLRRERNALKPITQLHDNLWDALSSIEKPGLW